ncbi:MAG: arginine N-succinyltransferase [Pseudomonadota bacterium]|nr:arginine N-succinyltransferase [Pseudomonadales bacterium]MDY6919497.1 arginine N-succinyltransferase [Pseudomonadota bacterium]
MLVIRLARSKDLQGIVQLAQSSGGGLTTLPPDELTLSQKLTHAVHTHRHLADNSNGLFWFVLEDTASGDMLGVAGIETAVGLDQTHYTYRVSTIVHASQTLQVYHQFPTLFLTSDHSGCSELCSLYLHPDQRGSNAGALLAKSRFLFVAQFPQLFAEKLIAELRGYLDAQGNSPFWEGLGRHFFDMDFSEADYLTAVDQKQFIAELMPRYPFYTNFLPEAARTVIGRVHDETRPARRLLEAEGFRYEGCVDIFDAGPTLECYVNRVRAVRDSYLASRNQVAALEGYPLMVCNPDRHEFRCTLLLPGTDGRYPDNVNDLWGVLQMAPEEKARCLVLARESSEDA